MRLPNFAFIIFLFSTLNFSCQLIKKNDHVNTDQTHYTQISSILYKDSLGNLYTHSEQILSEQQTEHYTNYYTQDVYDLSKDTTLLLKDVVDVASFVPIDSMGNYFADNYHIYTVAHFNQVLTILPIDRDNYTIEGSFIKDDQQVYNKDRKVKGANAKNFKSFSDENNLSSEYLAADGINIYFADDTIDAQQFDDIFANSPLEDSLKQIYFPPQLIE